VQLKLLVELLKHLLLIVEQKHLKLVHRFVLMQLLAELMLPLLLLVEHQFVL
jgi:hypothetical protein